MTRQYDICDLSLQHQAGFVVMTEVNFTIQNKRVTVTRYFLGFLGPTVLSISKMWLTEPALEGLASS